MQSSPPFSLVLSGGGLKGLAHVGVLQALEEHGLVPSLVVGSSMGALVAAGWAAGVPVSELVARAHRVRRRDVFQVAHADMAIRRLKAPAVYRREPLDALIRDLVGDRTFHDLIHPLVVNTVDIDSGMQVLWGLPGLRDARVADAVFASCALPGIFPPREIAGGYYADGAVVENLPVRIAAAAGTGPVVAVNVSSTSVLRTEVRAGGFAATYIRGLEIVMQTMMEAQLRGWDRPPLLLVHPRVEHVSMFSFDHSRELLEEGRRAMTAAIPALRECFAVEARGIYPQKRVVVQLDRELCIGCGACVMHAPDVFRLDGGGKAEVIAPRQVWSPLDGAYVRNCPTFAISARLAAGPAAD
ncbi:MAG TPA: patatin-like phospholipase family protein [Gemmatimonadales bacterium]|nr:patatin-like phospholipase family protein [Gemmatimonadales bacterium]